MVKLITEIYKSINHISSLPVWEFRKEKHLNYDLRKKSLFELLNIKTKALGKNRCLMGEFRGDTMDDCVRNEPTFFAFNNRIKLLNTFEGLADYFFI